jgi:hypothetical protein
VTERAIFFNGRPIGTVDSHHHVDGFAITKDAAGAWAKSDDLLVRMTAEDLWVYGSSAEGCGVPLTVVRALSEELVKS